jgi:hypothetical protein
MNALWRATLNRDSSKEMYAGVCSWGLKVGQRFGSLETKKRFLASERRSYFSQ